VTRRRVYGWLADHGGCGYYRVKLPLSTLPKDQWDVSYSTVLPIHWHEDAAVVVGQRIAKDEATRTWANVCKNPNVMAVYEVDDDFFNIDPTSIGWDYYRQDNVRDNVRRNAAMADIVTVSTPYLADLMREHNPNVALIPNYIPGVALGMDAPRDPAEVVVGWTSSATHDMDYPVVEQALKRTLARHPQVLVHFLGASYPGLPPERVRWTKWIRSHVDYLKWVQRLFDVGIAPLKPHIFNRSKSHLKALEYAALGIPAVVSDSPAYHDFVRHGQTGYLVGRDHEWSKWLGLLVNDPAARAAIGGAARVYAAEWTIEGNIGRWATALTP